MYIMLWFLGWKDADSQHADTGGWLQSPLEAFIRDTILQWETENDLTLSGAETTRHDTGGDTKLTCNPLKPRWSKLTY